MDVVKLRISTREHPHGPESDDKSPYQRWEKSIEDGAEIGVMQPHAKGRLESLEAEPGRKRSPLETSQGAWPCTHAGLAL